MYGAVTNRIVPTGYMPFIPYTAIYHCYKQGDGTFNLFPFQKIKAQTDTFQNNQNPNARSIASVMVGKCKEISHSGGGAARTSGRFNIGNGIGGIADTAQH